MVILVGGRFSPMQPLYTNMVAQARAEASDKAAYLPRLKPYSLRRTSFSQVPPVYLSVGTVPGQAL